MHQHDCWGASAGCVKTGLHIADPHLCYTVQVKLCTLAALHQHVRSGVSATFATLQVQPRTVSSSFSGIFAEHPALDPPHPRRSPSPNTPPPRRPAGPLSSAALLSGRSGLLWQDCTEQHIQDGHTKHKEQQALDCEDGRGRAALVWLARCRRAGRPWLYRASRTGRKCRAARPIPPVCACKPFALTQLDGTTCTCLLAVHFPDPYMP